MQGGSVHAATEMGLRVASMFLDRLPDDIRQGDSLWGDHYVVGFITSCAIKGAPSFGPELSDPKAVVPVAAAVLARLSGDDEPRMEEWIKSLARSRDEDFYLGAAAADKVLTAAWKRPGVENDPEIERARQHARSLSENGVFGGLTEEQAFLATLQKTFFTDVVRERLGYPTNGGSIET